MTQYGTDQIADTQRVEARMLKDSTLLAQAKDAITAWVETGQAGVRAGDLFARHSTSAIFANVLNATRAHGKQS